MEDELILSPADQAKLNAALQKMRANNEPQQVIDMFSQRFVGEFGKPAAALEEPKKKSTGESPLLSEDSLAGSSWKDLYETPRKEVPAIFGDVPQLLKSPTSAYGATPFKADEKHTYPFFHALQEEKPLARLEAAVEGKPQFAAPKDVLVDESPNEIQRLYNRAVARGLRGQIMAGISRPGQRIEDLAYLNYIEQRDAARPSDYLAAAPGTLAGSPSFILDVIRAGAESLISQVAASPVGIAGAVAGAGAGAGVGAGLGAIGGPLAAVTAAGGAGVGAMGGFSGATSLAMEYGNKVNEILVESGVDVTDPEALNKAFADEKLMAKAREKGLKRAVPVAAFDAVAGMVGGRFAAPALAARQPAREVAKQVAKEAGVQAALGAGGETAGQVAAGEEIRPRDIALEAAAEVLTPGISTAYNLAKESALTQPERDYIDFASQQDQRRLSAIRNLTFAVNNAEIANIDDQITDLKRSRIEEGRPERKAIDTKIQQLVEQKYSRMRTIQEDLLGVLSDEEIDAANTLVGDIINAQDVLKKNPDLSEAERTAIEEQFNSAAQQLQQIYDNAAASRKVEQPTPQPSDTETVAQEVQSAQQVGQEPGGVFKPRGGQAPTAPSRVLQDAQREIVNTLLEKRIFGRQPDGTVIKTPEQGERRSAEIRKMVAESEDPISLLSEEQKGYFEQYIKGGTEDFAKNEFLNLAEPRDRIIYVREMESQTPSLRREMEKVLLAYEAYKQVSPDVITFGVGFGPKGYARIGRRTGFDVKGSLGVTQTSGPAGTRQPGNQVLVMFTPQKENVSGVGYKGQYNPFKTAAHEVWHNVFASHFDKNEIDFNQLRELVIRRLKESDVRKLNDFANLYEERETPGYGGAYKSEEFMVDLGALLADEQVTFEKNFLEEMKAFLNNIVAKLTGQRVQIFEDAALAKDIAAYMSGVSQAIRTGANISAVPRSKRLQTDRFKRANKSTFAPDGALIDMRYENMAGRQEPRSYERELRSDEVLFKKIGKIKDDVLLSIEKFLKSDRLRGIPKAILQAMEVAESMNVEIENRLFLTMSRIRKQLNKLPREEQVQIEKLTTDALFSEDDNVRATAIKELRNGTDAQKKIASEISILIAIRDTLQDTLINSTAFDNLSDVLRETIKTRNQYYGTRTYRLFTDPKFKVDTNLKEQAINDLIQLEINDRAENMFFDGEEITDWKGDVIDDPDEADYMDYIQRKQGVKISDSVRARVDKILALQGRNKSLGEAKLGELRVPVKQFGKRGDLPESLRVLMGEETNPFVKFSQTVANLTSIIQRYTLVDRVNQAARNSGLSSLIIPRPVIQALKKEKLSRNNMISLGQQMGIIPVGETYKTTSKDLRNKILEKLRSDYTEVTETKSPMYGKWVSNDFLSLFQQTPLYDSNNKILKLYYKQLLQLRRIRVLYNLPTWRKNIMGGWYFLFANGVLPYNSARGGLTLFKDLGNRLKKWKTGEFDPETQAVFEEMGQYGLLSASINAGLLGEINNSYMQMYQDTPPNKAWSWLNRMNTRGARIGYQYGAIDDYTKMIAYLAKRENFAKRIASNPEGKSYAELNAEQQEEVRKMTAERIKQNFPTMSRLHPSFRQISKLPFGDFLSFRLEAFRSYFGVFQNAISDVNEAVSNGNLSASQRQAYFVDGMTSLVALITQATMSNIGYLTIAKSFFDDEEEKILAAKMREVPFLMPDWMKGSNVVPISMNPDGTIRYINISSEDPYDEITSLIFGREGISRSESLNSILSNFAEPNISVKLWYNIIEGKDNYGKPIIDNKDASWLAKKLGQAMYIGRQYFVPTNIDFIGRELYKAYERKKEDPDLDLKPLETAIQLSTNLVFRDYPVNIGQQFYYNLKDQKFEDDEPWVELGETERANRRARLDQVREAYQTIVQYGEHFENYDLQNNAEKNLTRSFRDDEDALLYIMYDIPLPE